MCSECWGFWLDLGELRTILERKDFEFSAQEKQQILDLRGASVSGPTEPAPCPRCGQFMKRLRYDQSVRIVLDGCEGHGLWLDTGKIKKVQALAEDSRNLQGMLLMKLGLLPNK